MRLEKIVSDIANSTQNRPDGLLQNLCDIQYQFNYIPQQAVELLASKLSVTSAHVLGVIGFYSFLHDSPRGEFDILISDSITDQMLGCRELLDLMCEQLNVKPGVPDSDNLVTVNFTSCTGLCDQGPAMLVNGRAIARLDKRRVNQIVELVRSRTSVDLWPQEFFKIEDNIYREGPLLSAEYKPGQALKSVIEKSADSILAEIDESGLRGRGGAGFKTEVKWRFCKQAEATQRYVICNADEGEPGTFKDRVLLNSYADKVFDGMSICAAVIGSNKGYLYLRAEYRYLRKQLEEILIERRKPVY